MPKSRHWNRWGRRPRRGRRYRRGRRHRLGRSLLRSSRHLLRQIHHHRQKIPRHRHRNQHRSRFLMHLASKPPPSPPSKSVPSSDLLRRQQRQRLPFQQGLSRMQCQSGIRNGKFLVTCILPAYLISARSLAENSRQLHLYYNHSRASPPAPTSVA